MVLSWDTTAVASFDRFTQEFDFEGVQALQRHRPAALRRPPHHQRRRHPTFFKAIARWDLDNGIRSAIPVFGGEAVYNLGDDTGLQFFYVDEDVTNGITHY